MIFLMNQSINEEIIRDYCLHHKLMRPYINKKKVICIISFVMIIVCAFSYVLHLLFDISFYLLLDFSISIVVLCFANAILRFLIHCYQHYASESTRRQCSCMPSCSEYALLALDKYIWPKALCKIWKRVTNTCAQPGYHIDYP